mmetsp:Transcript_33548/g.51587  ORF Transcript_33548/g.51587 Transcript_33548/m.51587 type:complete len:90 (-) Transcript_33548:930-1199(-)
MAVAPEDSTLSMQVKTDCNKTNFTPFQGNLFSFNRPIIAEENKSFKKEGNEAYNKSKSNEAQNMSSMFSLGLKLSARQSSKKLQPDHQI